LVHVEVEIIKFGKKKADVEKREVRAGTIACALEGWGECGVRVRVRADVAGRYLPPPVDSAFVVDARRFHPRYQPGELSSMFSKAESS
jgi:hypothetical protein